VAFDHASALAGILGAMVEDPDRRLVFLSHTSELRLIPKRRPYVAAAEAAVSTAGHAIADMAYLPAAARPPAEVCAAKVREADALVLIAGFRYGSPVPDRPSLSHTEWEFEVAGEARIPRLVFLLEEDADGTSEMTADPSDAARQREFRDRLRRGAGLTVTTVDSPGTLQAALQHSLAAEFTDQPASPRSQRKEALVTVRNSQGVQIGDGSVMNAVFHNRPHRRWRFPWPTQE
jgi:hypothetical protein